MKATKQNIDKWARNLKRLRAPGERRAKQMKPSSSLLALYNRLPKHSTVIDLGCGESADWKVAKQWGWNAFGLDVIKPKCASKNFVQAEVSDGLPFVNDSLDAVICHAMVALIHPWDRWGLYSEIGRVLKPGGLFSLAGYSLSDGFRFDIAMERAKIWEGGLHLVKGGVYKKCDNPKCQHAENLDDAERMRRSLFELEDEPRFVRTAMIFIGAVFNAFNVKRIIAFTGESQSEIVDVIWGIIDCGILNPETMLMDLPWLNDYQNDEVALGNIGLLLDCMAIWGEIQRFAGEDGPTYQAKAA